MTFPMPLPLFLLTLQQHMPLLQKYMAYEGTLYTNHYCTVAICCPSRANMWTGRAAHNLNVTDIFPPYGKQASKLPRHGDMH